MPIGDLQEEVVKKPFEFKTGETTKSVERENMKIERQLANENLWKEADPRFAEKHKSALRLRLRQNTTRLLFNEDRATINPELELIEAQLANLESLLQRPMTELTEAQAVIDAYSLVIAHMVDYENGGNGRFPVKKQRRARVNAIRTALEQELGSFAVAFHQFSKEGEIPRYISKAADVVEGRHIHPELTGSAAEKLAQDKHRLISLARDNGADDGQQMKDVKESFRGLAAALNTPLSTDPNDLAPQKEVILAHYEDVILTCAKYLKDHKNPRRQDGIERKAEVQSLHDRLTREKDYISAAADKLLADNPAGYTWTDVYGLAYLTATTAMRKKKPAPASSGSKSRGAGRKNAKRPQAEAAGKEQQIAQELTDVLKQSQEGLAAEKARQEMLFRKRYKPNMAARVRLLQTGIWDPNAKKGEAPAEGAQNGKRWEMWRFDREALARMSGENFFTDEEFRDKVIALNDAVVRNFEWFEDPQNYPLLKERFLEHLRGTMKSTMGAYNEHQKYVSLLSLDYPEIREAVIAFYRNNSKLLYVIQEDGAKFETTQDFRPDKAFHSILMPIRKLKKRKQKIDKELDLRDRGPEIYDSAAVKYLITSEEIDTPEYKDRMTALQKQIKGNDALIQSLISRHFSELTRRRIYQGLRVHLGDKALFADYRTLRDMTEDYLKTIALHDPESARVERDFDVAYTDTIHGPFAAHMRDAAAAVLSSASLRQEWKEAKGGSKQRSAMKKDLYRVKVAVDLLMEATDGVSLTQEGWDYITSYIRDHIAKVLKNEWEFEPEVYEKENRPRYKKLVENAAKKYNKGEVLTRKEWSQGFTDPAPGRELKTSDFSYGEIFKQAGIIDSEILSEVIPDVKLRRFLADNLGSIIIGNQELVDKLPFMKGIRGLDQLDRLTYGQFELVVSEIVGNLSNEEVRPGINKIIAWKDKMSMEKQRYLLLNIAKSRLDSAGVDALIDNWEQEERNRKDLKRKRAMILVGGEEQKRDGKIRFRFDDMPDRDKNIFQSFFGTGKSWMANRVRRFEQAQRVWDALEKVGPEAVEQVKQWCRSFILYSNGDLGKAQKELDNIKAMITAPPKKTEPKKKDKKRGIKIFGKAEHYVVDMDLRSKSGEGSEFLEKIKAAFTQIEGKLLVEFDEQDKKTNEAIDKKEEKLMGVEDFFLEMTMLGTQDVIFGHGGSGQQDFFTYSGDNYHSYRKVLLKWGKEAQERDSRLERALEPYKDNPALYKQMYDKLAATFLNTDRKGNEKAEAEMALNDEKLARSNELCDEWMQKLDHYTMEYKEAEEAGQTDAARQALEKATEAQKEYASARLMYEKYVARRDELLDSLYRQDSAKLLTDVLKNDVRVDGSYSDELCDTVELYQHRKRMVCTYGNGELASLFPAIEKHDRSMFRLLDPAESVAEAEIKKLHDKLAPLGVAASEQYDYVREYFLESNFEKILNRKDPEGQAHAEALKGLSFEKQVSYWNGVLLKFQDSYLNTGKQGTKSVREVMDSARGGLVDQIAEYLYYKDPMVKVDKKNQKKQFRKWWFIDSKNYGMDLAAQKGKQNMIQISRKKAKAIVIGSIEQYMHTHTDAMTRANNTGDLKNFYKQLGERYIANSEAAEKAFLCYVLLEERKLTPAAAKMKAEKSKSVALFAEDARERTPEEIAAAFTEEEIRELMEEIPDEEKQDLRLRLDMFRTNYVNLLVETDPEQFAGQAYGFAKAFSTKTEEARAADESFTEEHRAAYVKRREAMMALRGKVSGEKAEGRSAYRNKLFGGYLDQLKEFGERKQTLVYKPEKEKFHKKVKSKGEEKDLKLKEAARAYFASGEGEEAYPSILSEMLDEYMRTHHRYMDRIDRAADWVLREKNDVSVEADRLKRIWKRAKEAGVSAEDMDFALVYAAKYGGEHEIGIDAALKECTGVIGQIRELEAIPVSHPALKLAHRDACEKMRAWMFAVENKTDSDFAKFSGMITDQKNYFAFADRAYREIDRVLDADPVISSYDEVYRARYRNAAYDCMTAAIIRDSDGYFTGGSRNKEKTAEANIAKIAGAVRERIKDAASREAMISTGDSVSKEDFETANTYIGEHSRRDFEQAIVITRKPELLAQYNKLSEDQRKIFAMSLYCSQLTEYGSERVIYGQSDEQLNASRSQILAYINGDKVDFKVDYGRAIRSLNARSKNFKVSADTKLFDEAMEFTQMVEKRRFELRTKEWDRMSDSAYVAEVADSLRGEVVKSASSVTSQKQEIDRLQVEDQASFLSALENYMKTDKLREGSQGFIDRKARAIGQWKDDCSVDLIYSRVKGLNESMLNMLIYVLQDRTVLDFTSGGKDEETGIISHANTEKRFTIYEKLLSRSGREDALTESADPDTIRKAMASLLSFQIRDDKELTDGRLTKDDFVKSSLERVEAIDWELLGNAIDFIEEVERERVKRLAVRSAGRITLNSRDKGDKGADFYFKHVGSLSGKRPDELPDEFGDILLGAYHADRKNGDVDEKEDLIKGYQALTTAEKALFIRALEHRDILDISQKNLYRNIFGIAERDFVNTSARDELIDEYLLSASKTGGTIELKDGAYSSALLSLCSTQINDDMSFEQMNGVNWVDKNLTVSNQFFVKGKKTAIDWKLFKRALQFVTRAVNEYKMAAGDEELYNSLGDKSAGEMKFDRKYLRRNLHHTGSRFMRFLASEGYSEVSDKLSVLGTVAGFSDYVLSKKKSNFIKAQVNSILPKDAEEEEKKEEEKEEQEEKKEPETAGFLKTLADLANAYGENRKIVKELAGQVKDSIDNIKEIKNGPEEEEEKKEGKKDALAGELKELDDKRRAEKKKAKKEKEENAVTGVGCVDLVLSYAEKGSGLREMLDQYLVEDPSALVKADEYIEKYLGGFMSAKKIGELYDGASSWADEKAEYLNKVCLEKPIPAKLRSILDGTLEKLEASKDFLDAAGKYVGAGADLIGGILEIVNSSRNIIQLKNVKKGAGEAVSEDDTKMAGIDIEKYSKELVEYARGNNASLMNVANELTQDKEGRKILSTIGDLAAKGTEFAGLKGYDKVIEKAFKLADFIWKCFADRKMIYGYYAEAGNATLQRLIDGESNLHGKLIYEKYMNKEEHKKTGGKTEIHSKEVRLLRNGQGFERDEEMGDYLKLNIVHSLLFSASKFNPLKQPRLLAECTLTILGLKDAIGKTDSETAEQIFAKLKQ